MGSTEEFKHGRDRVSPFHGECGGCWKDSIKREKNHTRQARVEVVTTETEEKRMLTVSAENEKCLLKTGCGMRKRVGMNLEVEVLYCHYFHSEMEVKGR